MPRPTQPKVAVTPERVLEHLRDQIHFLQKSASDYDRGDHSEFRRMAIALRVLLHHNPPNSTSLLVQAGLAGTKMISSAPALDWWPGVFHSTLAGMRMGAGGMEVLPKLGAGPDRRLMCLDEWLVEIVIQDSHGHQFSRGYIIRSVANQDGGAHVDPGLDQAYHRLVNEHTWGLTAIGPDGSRVIGGVERVFIRQMAWEVLESLRGTVEGIEPQPEQRAPVMTGLSCGPFDPNNPPWGSG